MEVRNATVERIMDVARKEFLEKGYQGARMQAIADSAGINKASLHYYFDSKDKLFEAIFEEAMQKVLPIMLKALIEEPTLEEKIRSLVHAHISLYIDNPYLPGFIVNETYTNPAYVYDLIFRRKGVWRGAVRERLTEILSEEEKAGRIRHISAENLIMDLFSLTAFPFMAVPIFEVMFSKSRVEILLMLEERKTYIPQMILQSLRL
jgi:TetR/AcrR family transcriptional regulator